MCALDINRIGTDGVLIVFLFRAEMVNCSLQQLNFCLANNVVKFGLKCIDSLILLILVPDGVLDARVVL